MPPPTATIAARTSSAMQRRSIACAHVGALDRVGFDTRGYCIRNGGTDWPSAVRLARRRTCRRRRSQSRFEKIDDAGRERVLGADDLHAVLRDEMLEHLGA